MTDQQLNDVWTYDLQPTQSKSAAILDSEGFTIGFVTCTGLNPKESAEDLAWRIVADHNLGLLSRARCAEETSSMTVTIEIERRVTASADQYLKYEVSAADWDRYFELCEGDETEAVYALKDARLLDILECESQLDEVFEVHREQITISGGEEA